MRHSTIKSVLASFGLLAASVTSTSIMAADCDTDAGRKMFNRCAACHSLTENSHMMGPSLAGVSDRKVGSAKGFAYSTAMEQASFSWTAEHLDKFLENPMGYLPGTTMPFAGLKKEKARADLVCFLSQQ